jgi:hypothetical protein
MAKGDDPHWIEHMHMHKGALREKTHTPEGKNISEKKIAHAENSKNATTRRQAHLAEELTHLRHKKG